MADARSLLPSVPLSQDTCTAFSHCLQVQTPLSDMLFCNNLLLAVLRALLVTNYGQFCIGRIGKQTVPLELCQQLKRDNLLASPAKAPKALSQQNCSGPRESADCYVTFNLQSKLHNQHEAASVTSTKADVA